MSARKAETRRRTPSRGLSGRSVALVLAAILLLGAALRIAYLRETLAEPWFAAPLADAAFHDYWARGLASGDWTAPANEADPRIGEVPFLRPPGYPYFLGLVYRVLGDGIVPARLVQMALGLLNCALAFLLGRTLFSPGVGLLAAFGCATSWALIYFEGELQAPVLIQTLTLGLILSLLRWRRTSSWTMLVAAGLCAGAGALVRPNLLLFVPLAAVWIAGLGRGGRNGQGSLAGAAGFVAVAALAVLPATARNLAVSDELVLISANGPVNLYIGNNAEADGVTPKIPKLQEWTGLSGWSWFSYDTIVSRLARQTGGEGTYGEASRFFRQAAWSWIRENPLDFARLSLRRAVLFWGPDEISNNEAIRFEKASSPVLRWSPGFSVLLAAALLGIGLFVRRRKVADESGGESAATRDGLVLVGLLVAATFVSFVPFLVAARFRVPLLPFLFVLGAYAVIRVLEAARAGRWAGALGPVAAGVALWLVTSRSIHASEADRAWWHTDRANALSLAGRTEQAFDEYHAALAANPGYVDAHVHLAQTLIEQERLFEALPHIEQVLENRPYRNDLRMQLGTIYMQQGRFAEAVGALQVAVRVNPEVPEGHFELGRALTDAGRLEEGIDAFRESLRLLPDQPEAHLNVGIALDRLGRRGEAIRELRVALELDPFLAPAHYHLGNVLQTEGDLEGAMVSFEEAIRVEPDYVEPIVHLGNILNETGRSADAVAWYREAIVADPGHVVARYNLAGALGNLGRVDEAIEAVEGALEVQPGHGPSRQRLAILKRMRGAG